jgi:hypothetical protein
MFNKKLNPIVIRILSIFILLSCFLPSKAYAINDSADTNTWITQGVVNTIVSDENYTYIGGNFEFIGPQGYKYGEAANTVTGAIEDIQVNPNGKINTSISDGLGGWYIGGEFTKIGNTTRNYIAHISSSGVLDGTWNPNANNIVHAIVLSGSDIYVGGEFNSIGGESRKHIAKLNNTTGVADATWNPTADNINNNGYVFAITISGSDIYVGGDFTNIGGLSRNFIAKLNNSTGAANVSWNPNANQQVRKIAISGSDIYVLGFFGNIGGRNRQWLAKLNNTTGAADAAWNPDPNYNTPESIAISGSDIYVGGYFTLIGGQTRNYIAKLNNTTGAADEIFNPNANGSIDSILVSGSDIYVGGYFTSIGGQTRNHIAKLNNTTGVADATWDPSAGGTVRSLAIFESKLFLGGDFLTLNAVSRNRIARINNSTGLFDAIWNPNSDNVINSLLLSGSSIYVGGNFNSIGGQTRNYIAKLNNTTGAADVTWDANSDGSVYAIAISGSDIYAGGYFTTIGGATRNAIAKLNNTTGVADLTWDPNATIEDDSSGVNTIVISGLDIYAGGYFTTIGGMARNFIAKLNNSTGAADETWDAGLNSSSYVNAVKISGSDIYVGGEFTEIGGQSRTHIAKLNNTTGAADATWNAYSDNGVSTIAILGSDIYVGGYFTSIGGQTRNRIAKLNNTTGAADVTWDANSNGDIYSIAVSNEGVYTGGYFGSIGGNDNAVFFAKLGNLTLTPTPTSTPISTPTPTPISNPSSSSGSSSSSSSSSSNSSTSSGPSFKNIIRNSSGGEVNFVNQILGGDALGEARVMISPNFALPFLTYIWLNERTEADIFAKNSIVNQEVSVPEYIINSAVTKIYEFDPSDYQTGAKIETLPGPVSIFLPLTRSLNSINGVKVFRYDSAKKAWLSLANTSIVLTLDKKQVVFVTNKSGLYIITSSQSFAPVLINQKPEIVPDITPLIKNNQNTQMEPEEKTINMKIKTVNKKECFFNWCF